MLIIAFLLIIIKSQVLKKVSNCLDSCIYCPLYQPYRCIVNQSITACEQGFVYNKTSEECILKSTFQSNYTSFQLTQQINKNEQSASLIYWKKQKVTQCSYLDNSGFKKYLNVIGLFKEIHSISKQFEVSEHHQTYLFSFNLVRTSWMPHNDFLIVDIEAGTQLLGSYQISNDASESLKDHPYILCNGDQVVTQKFNIKINSKPFKANKIKITLTGFIFTSVWGITNIKFIPGCEKFTIFNKLTGGCDFCDMGFYPRYEKNQRATNQLVRCNKCPFQCNNCVNQTFCNSCIKGYKLSSKFACVLNDNFTKVQMNNILNSEEKHCKIINQSFFMNSKQNVITTVNFNHSTEKPFGNGFVVFQFFYNTKFQMNLGKIEIMVNNMKIGQISRVNLTNKGFEGCQFQSLERYSINKLSIFVGNVSQTINLTLRLVNACGECKYGLSNISFFYTEGSLINQNTGMDLKTTVLQQETAKSITMNGTIENINTVEKIEVKEEQKIEIRNESIQIISMANNTKIISQNSVVQPVKVEFQSNLSAQQSLSTEQLISQSKQVSKQPLIVKTQPVQTFQIDKNAQTVSTIAVVQNQQLTDQDHQDNKIQASTVKIQNVQLQHPQYQSSQQIQIIQSTVPVQQLQIKPQISTQQSSIQIQISTLPVQYTSNSYIQKSKVQSSQIVQNQSQVDDGTLGIQQEQMNVKEQQKIQASQVNGEKVQNSTKSQVPPKKETQKIQLIDHLTFSKNGYNGVVIRLDQKLLPVHEADQRLIMQLTSRASNQLKGNQSQSVVYKSISHQDGFPFLLNTQTPQQQEHTFAFYTDKTYLNDKVTIYTLRNNIKSKLTTFQIQRTDFLQTNSQNLISAFQNFFAALAWIVIVCLFISLFTAKTFLLEDSLQSFQFVFIGIYIFTSYLPASILNTVSGLRRIQNIDFLLQNHIIAIEKFLLGDLVQQGPLRFTLFHKDINFTRGIIPIVLLLILLGIWFFIVLIYSKYNKNIEQQQFIHAQNFRSNGEEVNSLRVSEWFISQVMRKIAQNKVDYCNQVFKSLFLPIMFLSFKQLNNFKYPSTYNGETINILFCLCTFISFIIGAVAFIFYCSRKYFKLEYETFVTSFPSVYYKKIPKNYLPTQNHRVIYPLLRYFKIFIYCLMVGLIGNHPLPIFIVMTLIYAGEIFYVWMYDVYQDSLILKFLIVESIMSGLLLTIQLILSEISSVISTEGYLAFGYVYMSLVIVLTLNSLVRAGYLIIDYVQKVKKEKINAIESERVV